MTNTLKLLTCLLLAGVMTAGLMGCAPSEEAAPTEEAAAEEAGLPPAMQEGTEEGSAPKRDEDGEEAAGDAEEAVDTSIRDAGEYGDDALVADLMPEGWSQTGPIEHYNVATLYNKIDGRSELYMAYDVRGLSWVSMVQDGNRDNFLDVFIYDMQNPTGAFGIYSVEREQGQEKLPLGRETYKTGSNYYFWKGQYYGYINASQTNADNDAAGKAVATALLDRITDDGSTVTGLDWLPSEGLIQDSIQYFKADAMSLDFLNNTFLGEYEFEGLEKFKAFVSKRADAVEAQAIVDAFNEYGSEYGDSVSEHKVLGAEGLVGLTDWGGDFYDGIGVIDNVVFGVTNVEGRTAAEQSIEKLMTGLMK